MRQPNMIVHLDVTPEESLKRIQLRSRGIETGISIEYLRALHAGYETFLDDISRSIPVIRVNWNTFQSAEKMATMIKEKYASMRSIHYVDFLKLKK